MAVASPGENPFLARVREVGDLPTLPSVYAELQRVLGDRRTTAKNVAEALEKDPALATKMLRIANSAFYGLAHEVTTISQAVVVLGFAAVRSTVLGTAVIGMFRPGRRRAQSFSHEDFWLHSLAVAASCRLLARRTKKADPEVAFVAGLVHDIGKLVEDQYFGEQFDEIVALVARDDCAIRDAEARVLGVTHAEIGALLVERWDLPAALCEGVRWHHRPAESGPMAAIVHLGDIFARTLTYGHGGDLLIPECSDAALDLLGLAPIDLDLLVTECATEADGARVFLEGRA